MSEEKKTKDPKKLQPAPGSTPTPLNVADNQEEKKDTDKKEENEEKKESGPKTDQEKKEDKAKGKEKGKGDGVAAELVNQAATFGDVADDLGSMQLMGAKKLWGKLTQSNNENKEEGKEEIKLQEPAATGSTDPVADIEAASDELDQATVAQATDAQGRKAGAGAEVDTEEDDSSLGHWNRH